MTLPYSLDLLRLGRAYAACELTPARVVRDILAEIDASADANPAWIHVVRRDLLLARAAALEERRSRGERLPLYGIPFGVKDNIDVAGCPTTAACPAFSYVASRSAHAVQRLEQAGALCIGKTNMDQFATGLVGTRSPFGVCRNPFDARYISGGSSSGSALAVALGHVSFALGTDTAGSGRVPAAFCNVVGLKPSRGLISMRGVVPACRSIDCMSVFALTVADAAVVCETAGGYDPGDPFSRAEMPRPISLTSATLTYGVPRADELHFFDEPAKRAFQQALEGLDLLGARRVDIDYELFSDAGAMLYDGPWLAERLAAIKPFFDAASERMHPVVREIIGRGASYTAVDFFEADYQLRMLKKECEAVFSTLDILVVPTAGTHYRIDEIEADPITLNTHLGYYTQFVNLLDLAALAVPAPFRADGLPFGVTLVAPAFHDDLLAFWGAELHRAARVKMGTTPFFPQGRDEVRGRPDPIAPAGRSRARHAAAQ